MNKQAFPQLESIESTRQGFDDLGYICSERIATTVFLAFQLGKPVLVDGPPGVGKTELAKTASTLLSLPLIRLQCYEGLDEAKALYEWKYGKQLLYTQILKEKLGDLLQGAEGLAESVQRLHEFGDIFYSEAFLEPRPLLNAMRQDAGAILLIDEIDKADYEFESLLLEILSDFQVSIPEIGTVRAHATAHGISYQQQYARDLRCPEASLPASVHSVSLGRAGRADRTQSRAGCRGSVAPTAGQFCALTARARPAQDAGDIRNH